MGSISGRDLLEFVAPRRAALAADPVIMSNLFSDREGPIAADAWLDALVAEATRSIDMIAKHLKPGARVLEVGGGIALCYAYLRTQGFAVTSLEPSTPGFGNRHVAGRRVLEILNVDASGWLPLEAANAGDLGRSFDLIFSFFVIEHISGLDHALETLAACLAPAGRMVHCCPNYFVPYEPHFGIPLMPLRPDLTPWLPAHVRSSELWQGLVFVTESQLRSLCAKLGLDVRFERGVMHDFATRLFDDSGFRARHRLLHHAARGLKRFGLLAPLEHWPTALSTPMVFEITRSGD